MTLPDSINFEDAVDENPDEYLPSDDEGDLYEDMNFYLEAFEDKTSDLFNYYTINLNWTDSKARKQLIKDLNYKIRSIIRHTYD